MQRKERASKQNKHYSSIIKEYALQLLYNKTRKEKKESAKIGLTLAASVMVLFLLFKAEVVFI